MTYYVENKFPKYSALEGYISVETTLEEIFNFSKSSINNKKNKAKCWPVYISEASFHNKYLKI